MTTPRILIHPGFHKTGTSSIQHFLWVNRAALTDHLAVLLLRHLKPAARICMAYSRDENPLRLTELVEVMDGILAGNDASPERLGNRDLLLSCEGLAGHLPGWPRVDTYAAAPITVAFLTSYFAERFPGAEVKVVMTTRDPASWLSSAWRHHLLGQRLRMDWDAYSAAYTPASYLMDAVSAVAEAVQPATLYTLPLEQAQTHPQGPGGALLEIAALPPGVRKTLRNVGHDNPGPDADTAQELLALNTSDLSDADVRARKQALAEQAKVGGSDPGADRLMPRQILIHAGFHKTGTSSVQATLKANGPRIWPTHALVLPQRLAEVTRMTTMHSVMGGPVSMAEYKDRLLTLFKGLTLGRKRGLILSAEDLAGLIPGRRGHATYDACPTLMAMTESCVRQVWGSDTAITFYFGLRDRADWMRSLYWQNLRSSRLGQDYETFAATVGNISLAETITRTKAALRHSRVVTIKLEDQLDTPFGPATPILETANLAPEHRARLVEVPPANIAPPPEIQRAILALNQSSGTDAEVAAQKADLIRAARPVPKGARIA